MLSIRKLFNKTCWLLPLEIWSVDPKAQWWQNVPWLRTKCLHTAFAICTPACFRNLINKFWLIFNRLVMLMFAIWKYSNKLFLSHICWKLFRLTWVRIALCWGSVISTICGSWLPVNRMMTMSSNVLSTASSLDSGSNFGISYGPALIWE